MSPPPSESTSSPLSGFFGVFRYSRRALGLVWETSRWMMLGLALCTLVAGVLPAVAAWVGQLIVDGVVSAMEAHQAATDPNLLASITPVLTLVGIEAVIIALIALAQRGLSAQQSLLRALLGQKVNVMILEKAGQLSLSQFEDSELYDQLTRARREASTRPLALVNKTFGLLQNAISLGSFGVLLVQFSPWALLILVAGALPVFISEAKFSGDAFRLFRWRSPQTRMQIYLETVLAREDSIKEVKLFGLEGLFLKRYRDIFTKLFAEDRRLTLRRESWGFLLGLLGTLTFYAAYAWVVIETIAGALTLGQMTMYLMVFKQGQAALSASLTAISGMYEDNLYLSNLYEYLEQPVEGESGTLTQGALPGDGLRFEHVSFSYPGGDSVLQDPVLHDISLHLCPGQSLALVGENGSGKTTLIKLLTRLYHPTQGRILLDGSDLRDWSTQALRERTGVIFQDFVRYQLQVGENLGVGDTHAFNDQERWQNAARHGMADEFITRMANGYKTQLGRWFKNGQELSGGQWQKIALSRAYMRENADILVLDEPTAAMDAAAEAEIFARFREHSRDKMAILISHRFSTVRSADLILVIDQGHIVERGTHEELLATAGRYAKLFQLQAAGYK
ncbi:ABC transporter ATP-binding protein [Vreelandella titanicae]|nr:MULTISPECIES: ABC transporter ATP-binding protein [Halomonas]KIN16703.1 ABC transporter permease [Halomonas sp. KHS3]MCD1588946.1 ABC transporter ATP-binding protein/permease [Halomonas sp. IOP_14]NVE90823.1 ABC transporter ATP-binding protein [Halomonas titanicae]QKS22270.1 Lipid A export ATP-binding/permease protein MsbA [Halomonas titanicae]QNU62577.1 ABC transporter ATP-binding protein [Halomonas titanicae]